MVIIAIEGTSEFSRKELMKKLKSYLTNMGLNVDAVDGVDARNSEFELSSKDITIVDDYLLMDTKYSGIHTELSWTAGNIVQCAYEHLYKKGLRNPDIVVFVDNFNEDRRMSLLFRIMTSNINRLEVYKDYIVEPTIYHKIERYMGRAFHYRDGDSILGDVFNEVIEVLAGK